MRIQAAELAEGPLAGLHPTIRCRPDCTFYCSNIRFWDGIYDSDCLYIARSSELPAQPPAVEAPCQLQLLLIEDVPVPTAYLSCPAACILTFPVETDPLRLYNAINDSGFSLPRYAMKLTELLESIPEDDFATISRRIGNILGRSAALLTPSFRLLACSDAQGVDARRLRQIRHLPSNELSAYLCAVMFTGEERRAWPVREFPRASGALLMPIIHEGELKEILGYIYCPDIPRGDALANASALRYISQLLASRFLQFIREGRGDDTIFSILLGKVISGEIKDDGAIAAALKQMGFSVPRHMVLITVLADNLSPEAMAACVEALHRDVWPQTRAALVGSQIILLLGRESEPVITPEELELFAGCLEKYQCTAGISETFRQLDHFLRN